MIYWLRDLFLEKYKKGEFIMLNIIYKEKVGEDFYKMIDTEFAKYAEKVGSQQQTYFVAL